MNEEISSVLNAVGAMAEVLRVFYENLVEHGFTKQEALYLVSDYMKTVFGARNIEWDWFNWRAIDLHDFADKTTLIVPVNTITTDYKFDLR